MYYVYLLHSEKTKKLYKGSCSDLKARIYDHNSNRVRSTKSGIPWKLVYYEAFADKTDALKEERFLKTGKGRERIKYLLSAYLKKINGEVPERSKGAPC